MPPKPNVAKPALSPSSLLHVPDNAVIGFKERIENGIVWTILANAARHQHTRCDHETEVTIEKAINKKIERSICREFLDKDTRLTLDQSWDISLPMTFWDIEKFADDIVTFCFQSHNNITDDLVNIIKLGVKRGDRELIRRELKNIRLLRLIDCKLTNLDPSLAIYEKVHVLNLSCNFLTRIETEYLPGKIEVLELNTNKITNFSAFTNKLPTRLSYLGLGRNLFRDVSHDAVTLLKHITVLDLSDNDINDLDEALDQLRQLPKLCSLSLIGNPCSVCAAYAIKVLDRLPNLAWLDDHEILEEDRPKFKTAIPAVDLKSTRFVFTVLRVLSVPPPPKVDKGVTLSFYVELEIPLLDSKRRQFLMYRRNESLIETILPSQLNSPGSIIPEKMKSDVDIKTQWSATCHYIDTTPSLPLTSTILFIQALRLQALVSVTTTKLSTSISIESEDDIYNKLTTKNSNVVLNYTVFESNKVQWNKIMTFQVPTVKIFCPDLQALRDTFRSEITVRLICSMCYPSKQGKAKGKNTENLSDQYCTLAVVKCSLENPHWNKNLQYFVWDDLMESEYAKKSEVNLSLLQYSQIAGIKPAKTKSELSDLIIKREVPDNLTCHFGFGIETLRA